MVGWRVGGMPDQMKNINNMPLDELVRKKICGVLDQLGSQRTPDLYRRVIEVVERVLIEETLDRAAGSRGKTAEILGIHRNTLRGRMHALGIVTDKLHRCKRNRTD